MRNKEFSKQLEDLGWTMEGSKHISWINPNYPDWFILRSYYESGGIICYTKGEACSSGFSKEDIDIHSIEDVKEFMQTH